MDRYPHRPKCTPYKWSGQHLSTVSELVHLILHRAKAVRAYHVAAAATAHHSDVISTLLDDLPLITGGIVRIRAASFDPCCIHSHDQSWRR